MSRRSLRPQLNQIRTWVRQGRTDAWIAHQLEVTVQQIQTFKRENELAPDENGDNGPTRDFEEEVDLRAEDDALIASELEAEAARKEEEQSSSDNDAEDAAAEDDAPKRRPRRRGRRGTTRRRAAGSALEGTFDHGEEGYGLWLDPAVQDDPVYAEHWAGQRPVEVMIEEDQIVIRRSSAGAEEDEDE